MRERDALELHLEVATLDILKPDSHLLLNLVVDDGDGTVPWDPDAVFRQQFVELGSVGDGLGFIGSGCSNQWLNVNLSLPHSVVGGKCVLVIDLLPGELKANVTRRKNDLNHTTALHILLIIFIAPVNKTYLPLLAVEPDRVSIAEVFHSIQDSGCSLSPSFSSTTRAKRGSGASQNK